MSSCSKKSSKQEHTIHCPFNFPIVRLNKAERAEPAHLLHVKYQQHSAKGRSKMKKDQILPEPLSYTITR